MSVKPGKDTSEYKVVKNTSVLTTIGFALGLVIAAFSAIATTLGDNTVAGIIFGASVSVLSILQDTFIKLGYIKSRTEIKRGMKYEGEDKVYRGRPDVSGYSCDCGMRGD